MSNKSFFERKIIKYFQFHITYDVNDAFRPFFDELDRNKDSEVTTEELKENGAFEQITSFREHIDEFLAKFWPIFDTDNSGTLNFEETMYYTVAIVDGAARLMIKVRKHR